MGNGFAVAQWAAASRQGPRLAANGTRPRAGGTGGLRRERFGLLFQESGESALRQPAGGGDGDLFHGRQVGVETGAGVPEGASGGNFAPTGREIVDILELFGC